MGFLTARRFGEEVYKEQWHIPELLVEGPGTEDTMPGSPGALAITCATTTSREKRLVSLHPLWPATR